MTLVTQSGLDAYLCANIHLLQAKNTGLALTNCVVRLYRERVCVYNMYR